MELEFKEEVKDILDRAMAMDQDVSISSDLIINFFLSLKNIVIKLKDEIRIYLSWDMDNGRAKTITRLEDFNRIGKKGSYKHRTIHQKTRGIEKKR